MPSDGPSLAEILDRIGRGRWLPADGGVLVVPPPSARSHGVLAFTGHHVIVTDADPDWVRAQLPPGDLSAPLNPPFLDALCARTGRRVNNIDLVTVAPGNAASVRAILAAGLTPVGAEALLVPTTGHPLGRRR